MRSAAPGWKKCRRRCGTRRRGGARRPAQCRPAQPPARRGLLLAPSQQPLHEKLIEPVRGKAEEGDGEHDRVHAFVRAGGAEIADQVDESLLRHISSELTSRM